MTRILLVDTNFSTAPIYDYMIKCGYKVFVCGSNPADFLAKPGENYINIDYSDIEKTRYLIRSLSIDYIVPGCNDLSYQVCVDLNSDGKFPGLDDAEVTATINNKKKFRAFAKHLGLPVPRVINLEKIDDIWPVIVKPVDAYSGRGVTIVSESERSSLPAAIQRAKKYSRTDACIIEEYVDGQLYSHSAFFCEGAIQTDFIVEEYGSVNPFAVDTSRVIHDFSPAILQNIRNDILLMAGNLGLVNGLIHTQFILNENSYWIIEVTRRCPGDLYAELIERSTGFRYAEMYTNHFLNKNNKSVMHLLERSFILRHTISQSVEKTFKSLQFNIPLQIEKLVPLSIGGDSVKESPFGRIGLLFVKARSAEELSALLKMALNRELYTIH